MNEEIALGLYRGRIKYYFSNKVAYEWGVTMKMNFENREDILTHMSLFIILGIIVAIQNDAITPEEGEVCFFNPYISNNLKAFGIRADIIELIESCAELDDVKRIVSKAEIWSKSLNDIYQKCIDILNDLENLSYPLARYIESKMSDAN